MTTSLERVLTALRRGVPDQVPSFEWEIDDISLEAFVPGGDLFDFVEWSDLDAVAIFADLQGYPRRQVFRLPNLPGDLVGFQGATEYDFYGSCFRRPAGQQAAVAG